MSNLQNKTLPINCTGANINNEESITKNPMSNDQMNNIYTNEPINSTDNQNNFINENRENFNLFEDKNDNNNLDNYKNGIFSESLNSNKDEDNSFLLPTEPIGDMSIITEDDLPSEIHNHPIIKYSLNYEICTICNKKRTCKKGYKCENCSLKVCNKCVKSVISHYYSNDKHRDSLVLLENNNWICDICKNQNNFFQNNFCFYCDKCNFGICIHCFCPKNRKEEDMFHEHPLIYGSDFPTFVCKLCGEEKKEGNKCINCDFKLCEECSNKIFISLVPSSLLIMLLFPSLSS